MIYSDEISHRKIIIQGFRLILPPCKEQVFATFDIIVNRGNFPFQEEMFVEFLLI